MCRLRGQEALLEIHTYIYIYNLHDTVVKHCPPMPPMYCLVFTIVSHGQPPSRCIHRLFSLFRALRKHQKILEQIMSMPIQIFTSSYIGDHMDEYKVSNFGQNRIRKEKEPFLRVLLQVAGQIIVGVIHVHECSIDCELR